MQIFSMKHLKDPNRNPKLLAHIGLHHEMVKEFCNNHASPDEVPKMEASQRKVS